METVYNKENLQAHLERIKPAGYTLDSFNSEFFYVKNEPQRKIIISPMYNDFFPHDVVFASLFVDVLFTNVEQIFHDIYVNHQNVDFKHFLNETPTFSKGFSNILSTSEKDTLKMTKVYNDPSFSQVQPLLQQMISAAVSFVNQNQTLQDFYNLGETMNIEEQANFYLQPLPQRKLIIKKLLNIPYNQYATDLINFYTNVEPDTQEVNFLQALRSHLDSI